ncbi:mRNA 3 end-processing YTH1 [Purpureocillium lavendulum]|uniref:mRNA 3 end-processing YTH1 n=1 Tax=Purpureocillium lavendulum TaxID=1247861 RepID=A0AB34FCA8_9HYPO|nr:mRNA 3 end-processing YTH1 [Purpureocillium lavendulum]
MGSAPVDRVPPCPLLNESNTEETFRTTFAANPSGLMKEVFLVCNAAYSMQEVIDSLRISAAKTSTEVEDLQNRLENTLITKSDGDATITRLIAENEAYLKVIQSGGASRRSPEHPDPEAFTGEDPSLLPSFLQQLDLKLEMNKDWWSSEHQRMGYAVSCLKGRAHDQVSYNIKDGVVLFDSVNAIKAILRSAFGDIDAKATAQRKIFDMKQGHKPLTVFLPEWYAIAKLTEWDSEALIAHLRRALHDDITWRLSLTKAKDTPSELTQFMDLVRTCDNECRQVDANYFRKKNAGGSTKNSGHVPAPAASPLTTPNESGDSMDLIDDTSTSIKTNAMLDSGATGKGFVDESFAHANNLTLYKLRNRRRLNVVDGRPSSAGDITHVAKLEMDIKGHKDRMLFYVTKLGKYDIILGKPWLTDHNPVINWSTNMVSFNSEHCRRHCMEKGQYQLAVTGASPLAISTASTTLPRPSFPRRVGAAAFYMLAEKRDVDVFSLSLYEIDKRLAEIGVIAEVSTFVEPKAPRFGQALTDLQKMNRELARQEGLVAPLPKGQRAHELQASRRTAADMYLSGASLEDIRKALEPKVIVDPATKVPHHYHEFLKVFDQSEADKLPPHRDCDHEIQLQPGTTPPHGPLYSMSEDELVVLRKFLQENLDKGFIRASTSPAASPVLFAKKPGGGLRFCVDYRGLNAITIKNRYPLPLIQETLSQLSQAKYFTKLDVVAAFNRIRIKEGQEWMTAFNTRYGLFESLVMPFGLSNAPATFQARINEVLRPFLDRFCTAYIDDILIYSNDLASHRLHVKSVLQALEAAGLQLDVRKCEFETTEVKYLGMIISTTGVRMDPAKVDCLVNWERPVNVKDVQAFLGFSNFYRRFIKGFSRIVRPLVALTRKSLKWNWTLRCQEAFDALKDRFTSAPILRHFDPAKEVFVECDASDFVSSGILSQKDDQGVLHPVAFMSKKYDPAECNYEIYDKELLAIVRCFECWRPELQGAHHEITVVTDHANLRYFMTTKQLSRRQVRWSEFLSQFQFAIKSIPGKENGKADSLTRRAQDVPQDENDERIRYQQRALLKRHNIDRSLQDQLKLDPELSELFANLCWEQEIALCPAILDDVQGPEPIDHKITRLLDKGYEDDEWWTKIRDEMLKPHGVPHSKDIPLSECTINDGRLYFRERLYVPQGELRTLLIQLAHDSVESGHPGKNKLYELISRSYWWPGLNADARRFVRNCHGCLRNKTSRLRYQGTLKPLPIPLQRWRDLSVDFIGPIKPTARGFNAIMVVVDRLSKDRHFSPCRTDMKAHDLAMLFVRDVWKLHGLPDSIVSDRGPLFVSEFWKAVCHRLQIKIALSTAYHPETDGQTENANAFLEQYLRQYVSFAQDDWDEWLPLAEFAARNAVNDSTGMSPFFANTGYHPRMSFGPPRPLPRATSKDLAGRSNQGNGFAAKMQEITDLLRTNLTPAQASQEQFANANRSPAPAYRVGDKVLLSTRNIHSARPIPKLDHKFIGPFRVKRVLNAHSYQLNLPHELDSLHNSFHPNLLRPAPNDPLPGQYNPPPPPIALDANGEKLWAIEAILDSKRTRQKGFQYHVQWRGYDLEDATWEPLQNVVNAHMAIKEFEKRHKTKPRPTKQEMENARLQAT